METQALCFLCKIAVYKCNFSNRERKRDKHINRNSKRYRKEKRKEKEESIRLRTRRTCNRHIKTEILIKVKAVMFKLLDNILPHVFTGLLFVDK